MDEFEGFKDSNGTIIYSPNEFLDFCQNFLLDYSLGESTLIHLHVVLYVQNSDSEYVDAAMNWALSQLGLDQEIQRRISRENLPSVNPLSHLPQELLTTIQCYLGFS